MKRRDDIADPRLTTGEDPLLRSRQEFAALAGDLRAAIEGEVRFDTGSRALYSADASNYRQVPIGVVVPKTLDDLVAAVRVCRAHDVPILPRGGGTSQCGQCVNVAVVIDASKDLTRIIEVDPIAKSACVEPGVVCDALRAAAERHELTFGPDPATHSRCTLGGMIGNNSCGPHSVMSGKTEENIEALEVLTYDGARFWVGPTMPHEIGAIIEEGGRRGEIYAALRALRDRYADEIRLRFPNIRRRVSGYNLHQLLPEYGFNVARALVGSEGTCALTLQARTKLVASPQGRSVLVLGFPDIFLAGDAVSEIAMHEPIAMEGLDERIVRGLRERNLKQEEIGLLPEGRAWLVLEFGGIDLAHANDRAGAVMRALQGRACITGMRLIDTPARQASVWSIRELGASATALSLVPEEADPVVGWEDAAVNPARLGDYLRDFSRLIERHGYRTSLYGHFGDGCIHARITFDLRSDAGLRDWRRFLREAAELVVSYGGSISGEHGDGNAKAEFLPIMYGDRLIEAFREFKSIWDPGNRMNPRNLVDPYRADENLRMGPDYRPAAPVTYFSFAREGGLTRSVEHCIGMGRCRSNEVGTMCPSYRATREERHSTRGRARLLFEMLRGETIGEGWWSEDVKEALDLCLACKACKSECPTHVDMATFKAEFLAHYHERRRRPVQAWSMGMIGAWAPVAARVPWLVNACTRTPVVRALAKAVAGIAQSRALPALAASTFRDRFAAAPPSRRNAGVTKRVLLWPDTFNNHFRPDSAAAGAEVLAHAGYAVEIPAVRLCCGRPLYDFGFLDRARRELARILEALREPIDAGVPLVGLEPACVSVFRDELPNLFPADERARALSRQTFLLSEFLVDVAGYEPPYLGGRALLHGHCHQKSMQGLRHDLALLTAAGLVVDAPDSGCCGMAGAFGFDRRKVEVSRAIGERVLLPSVRAAEASTLIVTCGYSCREQVEQSTSRSTLHVADVLRMALHAGQGAHAPSASGGRTEARPRGCS